jgi:hypothetical protein
MSRSLIFSTRLCFLAAVLALAGLSQAVDMSLAQDAAADPAATPTDTAPPVAVRADAPGTHHTFDLSSRAPAARKIEQALDDPQGVDIDFIDQPLKEAFEYLADAHGIPILIDVQALTDEGVQTDEPLNLVLSKMTLRSALNIMLDPLGLTYVIEDEVLMITTQVVADEQLETRVYDVRPLIRAGFDSEQLAKTIRETIQSATWPEAQAPRHAESRSRGRFGRALSDAPAGGGGLPFDPTKLLGTSTPAAQRKPADDNRPDTALVALEGALVVTHNQATHRRLVALLEQLQRFADLGAPDGR